MGSGFLLLAPWVSNLPSSRISLSLQAPAMVTATTEKSVIRKTGLTSVGPGKMTGPDVVHELTGLDLSTKLHYLRGVYFFRSQALRDLTLKRLKEAMSNWSNGYPMTCGRFRRWDSGRPYIKCNDSGARFVESESDLTMEEWLANKDSSAHTLLFPQQVIGPELAFSPPLLFQYTRFKCGGISLGLSCSHVVGDIHCVAEFINSLIHFLPTSRPNHSPPTTIIKPFAKSELPKNPPSMEGDPLSLKRVDPVGDLWTTVTRCKMENFSFHLTSDHIQTLRSENDELPIFESVCAILWHCIAKVRNGLEPRIVTICKASPRRRTDAVVGNNQITISTVEADFSIKDEDPKSLAKFLAAKARDETTQIENAVDRDDGASDFIVYGANLTFVDWEDVEFYELELNEQKPALVYYEIQEVGEEGVVVVQPLPNYCTKDGDWVENGRLVTVTLPEKQVLELKSELLIKGFI